jgi:hypothetical protein
LTVEVIQAVFPAVSLLRTPQTIPTDSPRVRQLCQLGTVRLHDGRNLALFEVEVDESVCIARNRSLQKAARYADEDPRPDLPRREDLEATSRRFSLKYLLAVMNSSVARDFLRANRRSNIHLYPDDWKKLPVPDITPEGQAPIVALVDQILAAKAADPTANVSDLEAALNARVAALCGPDSRGCSGEEDVQCVPRTEMLCRRATEPPGCAPVAPEHTGKGKDLP